MCFHSEYNKNLIFCAFNFCLNSISLCELNMVNINSNSISMKSTFVQFSNLIFQGVKT